MTDGDSELAFLRTLSLLYVDDDPDALEEVGEFLARRAGTVVTAADGLEGLAAFRELPAQIVITDIRMPRLDGLAMAREIRRLDPTVHLIITTAYDDPDYLRRSISTGVDQYVLKPIQRANLEFALLTCAHRLRDLALVRTPADALDPGERQRLALLTAREREVLVRLGRGQSSREIGQGLGISPKTVHVHQANLMMKLGLHKATALAAFAMRAGLA